MTTALSTAEAAVLDRINIDDLLGTVADLVAVPSVGGAETPAQERVAAFLRQAGLAVDLFDHLQRPFAICVGRVEAGDWPSSEADWLRAEGRYGVAPGEDLEGARAELEAAVAAAAADDPWLRDHPPMVEWRGGQFYPATTPPDHPVVTSVTGAFATATGSRPRLEGVPYGSDMGLIADVAGVPTVVFGPGDVRVAHRPDVFVPVGQLLDATRTLALTALRFCGGGPS